MIWVSFQGQYGPEHRPALYLYFDEEWLHEFAAMSPGTPLTVIGKIRKANSWSLTLEECELEEESTPSLPSRSAVVAPIAAADESGSEPEAATQNALVRPIFDHAPPELADMTRASIVDLFAGRTQAQGDKLMRHHVNKPVRVSGTVAAVALGGPPLHLPRVTLEGAITLLLFFDPDDDYDPEPIVLALNKGDKIVASALVHQLTAEMVSLHHCKLIDVRGKE